MSTFVGEDREKLKLYNKEEVVETIDWGERILEARVRTDTPEGLNCFRKVRTSGRKGRGLELSKGKLSR